MKVTFSAIICSALVLFFFLGMNPQPTAKAGDQAVGTRKYDDYQTPKFCGTSCHTDF